MRQNRRQLRGYSAENHYARKKAEASCGVAMNASSLPSRALQAMREDPVRERKDAAPAARRRCGVIRRGSGVEKSGRRPVARVLL